MRNDEKRRKPVLRGRNKHGRCQSRFSVVSASASVSASVSVSRLSTVEIAALHLRDCETRLVRGTRQIHAGANTRCPIGEYSTAARINRSEFFCKRCAVRLCRAAGDRKYYPYKSVTADTILANIYIAGLGSIFAILFRLFRLFCRFEA